MPMRLARLIRGVVIGGLLALSVTASMSCKKEAQAGMPGGKPPPPNVIVAASVEQEVPIYLDEIGKATAYEMVTIMPQIAGRIEALHFVDGADLKKGDLLFTIDARPFQALLEQSKGQLAKDQAALGNAERFLNRQSDIYKQGFVSPSDYDTAQFNAKGAKAAVEADQASIASPA